MSSLALHIIRGIYKKVFIFPCVWTLEREREHSNILFFVLKRAAKAMQNCPWIKQHYKDKDNFRNCKFFFRFFSFPYRTNRKGKSLLYRYIFSIFVMLKYKRLWNIFSSAPLPLVRSFCHPAQKSKGNQPHKFATFPMLCRAILCTLRKPYNRKMCCRSSMPLCLRKWTLFLPPNPRISLPPLHLDKG